MIDLNTFILKLLKHNHIKATPQRLAIINTLLEYDHFSGTQNLYDRISEANPNLGSATIYRTLSLFKDSGIYAIIMKISNLAKSLPNIENGHTLAVCYYCGNEQFLPNSQLDGDDNEFDGFQSEFSLRIVYGVCGDCRKRELSGFYE